MRCPDSSRQCEPDSKRPRLRQHRFRTEWFADGACLVEQRTGCLGFTARCSRLRHRQQRQCPLVWGVAGIGEVERCLQMRIAILVSSGFGSKFAKSAVSGEQSERLAWRGGVRERRLCVFVCLLRVARRAVAFRPRMVPIRATPECFRPLPFQPAVMRLQPSVSGSKVTFIKRQPRRETLQLHRGKETHRFALSRLHQHARLTRMFDQVEQRILIRFGHRLPEIKRHGPPDHRRHRKQPLRFLAEPGEPGINHLPQKQRYLHRCQVADAPPLIRFIDDRFLCECCSSSIVKKALPSARSCRYATSRVASAAGSW